MTRPARPAPGGIVTTVVEEIFAAVHEVESDAVRMLDAVRARSAAPRGADISELGPGIRALLARTELVVGLGLIVAPGLLDDEQLRLEWGQRGDVGDAPTALDVDLNRLSSGFYDYEAAEWFAVPRRTGARHVVGPYVDVHGTGSYMLTFTVPVMWGGAFVGVAGADVPAARFEERLLERLSTSTPSVLLNADDRVVFSSSARWLAGSRLVPAETAEQLELVDLPALPWRWGRLTRNH
jgi:hypothetical protein